MINGMGKMRKLSGRRPLFRRPQFQPPLFQAPQLRPPLFRPPLFRPLRYSRVHWVRHSGVGYGPSLYSRVRIGRASWGRVVYVWAWLGVASIRISNGSPFEISIQRLLYLLIRKRACYPLHHSDPLTILIFSLATLVLWPE